VDALLALHIPGLTDELFFESIEKTSGWLFKSRHIELQPLPAAKRSAPAARGEEPLAQAAAFIEGQPEGPARA
jgi:hypothetical protein